MSLGRSISEGYPSVNEMSFAVLNVSVLLFPSFARRGNRICDEPEIRTRWECDTLGSVQCGITDYGDGVGAVILQTDIFYSKLIIQLSSSKNGA